ncbi:CwfJ C-terminus 1-domain-containing protein-like protein [Polychytrium aggregatum]|uniref:CwfJ C-terminus 1-domain-containing protein-like protein n=1 Tax=Polychytrium aggregatum TaxID=110093 RepID=UPI0022FEDBDF|nr:CwfJ C-terminus 1-domain-containing protein-like protein [Polychytrium aggregatum]KAI9207302.1 CwfJ C-terminus 1-domain-containing protein-like protein [Polychytrium aggregatum]
MTTVKILAVGPVRGQYKTFASKISSIHAKNGPFDLIFCVGEFFAPTDDEEGSVSSNQLQSLLDGDLKVPTSTYVLSGSSKIPEKAKAAMERSGGDLAENLFFLGPTGVYTTTQGIRIAYVGGDARDAAQLRNLPRQCEQLAGKGPKGIDILLSFEYPFGIQNQSELAAKAGIEGQLGSQGSRDLASAREPYYNTNGATHVTRFIGLGPFGSKAARWFYACNVTPMSAMTEEQLSVLPACRVTDSPFMRTSLFSANSNKRGPEVEEDMGFFWNTGKRQRPDGPPDGYVCKICNIPGHFVKECPNRGSNNAARPPPPDTYTCNACNQKGHWIQNCPEVLARQAANSEAGGTGAGGPPDTYTCNICSQKGHWIRNCPQKSAPGGNTAVPEGYLCKICNVPGHLIRNCPKANETTEKKAYLEQRSHECWFCLSNTKLEKHLIVSIGDEVYVTLAKGGLSPWGGHLLIVPIAHYPNIRLLEDPELARENPVEGAGTITAEAGQRILDEMDAIKLKFAKAVEERDEVLVAFEMFGGYYSGFQHMHLQLVPIPKALLGSLEQAFSQAAEGDGYDLTVTNIAHDTRAYPVDPQSPYCHVEFRDTSGDTKHIIIAPTAERLQEYRKAIDEGRRARRALSLIFPRAVLANLIGRPDHADWKACILPKDDETVLAKDVKKLFA